VNEAAGNLASRQRFLYVFLDESGNFDFSRGGTKYFVLTSLSKERPFAAYQELAELKYDLIEKGEGLEYFHASENQQHIRDAVFEIIQTHMGGIRLDSVVVEKRKLWPAWRAPEKFYARMLGYLLRHLLDKCEADKYQQVVVITDRLPLNKKRGAVEKSIKKTLAEMLPGGVRYRLLHHDAKSNFDLQIVDYCCWAIYRKWDTRDERSYNLISSVIASEFDIFRSGQLYHY